MTEKELKTMTIKAAKAAEATVVLHILGAFWILLVLWLALLLLRGAISALIDILRMLF